MQIADMSGRIIARPLIYLCGPIHGLTMEQAGDWREQATALLKPEFDVLNPMSGKVYRGTSYSEYTDEEIVTRDLAYIRASRAVLRYFPQSSEGSAMETFFAGHLCGTPVVLFGEEAAKPRNQIPLWARHFSVRNFAYLEQAVTYLKEHWLFPSDPALNAG